MALPLSKRDVRELGKLLAQGLIHPSSPQYAAYQLFMSHCDAEQSKLEDSVKEILDPKYAISGRRKSRNTLQEKLHDLPTMQLTHIRDLVGVRIVGDMNLDQQNQLAELLKSNMSQKTELIDRRLSPNNGYRALHIEIKLDGITGEIQIRTPLQSAWADSFERLADKWGRQIRYGREPNLNSSGTNLDRIRIVKDYIDLSETYIRDFEQETTKLQRDLQNIRSSSEKPRVGASRLSILNAMRKKLEGDKIDTLKDKSEGLVRNWREDLLVALEELARHAEEVE